MLNLSHLLTLRLRAVISPNRWDFYHNKLGLEIVLELEIPDALAQDVGLAPTGFRQVRLKAGKHAHKIDGYRIATADTCRRILGRCALAHLFLLVIFRKPSKI